MSDLQEVITAAVVGVAIVVLLIWQQWRLNHARQDAARLTRITYEMSFRKENKQPRDARGRFVKKS